MDQGGITKYSYVHFLRIKFLESFQAAHADLLSLLAALVAMVPAATRLFLESEIAQHRARAEIRPRDDLSLAALKQIRADFAVLRSLLLEQLLALYHLSPAQLLPLLESLRSGAGSVDALATALDFEEFISPKNCSAVRSADSPLLVAVRNLRLQLHGLALRAQLAEESVLTHPHPTNLSSSSSLIGSDSIFGTLATIGEELAHARDLLARAEAIVRPPVAPEHSLPTVPAVTEAIPVAPPLQLGEGAPPAAESNKHLETFEAYTGPLSSSDSEDNSDEDEEEQRLANMKSVGMELATILTGKTKEEIDAAKEEERRRGAEERRERRRRREARRERKHRTGTETQQAPPMDEARSDAVGQMQAELRQVLGRRAPPASLEEFGED